VENKDIFPSPRGRGWPIRQPTERPGEGAVHPPGRHRKMRPLNRPRRLDKLTFPNGAGAAQAVSPLASIPLHDLCAACGREIKGGGFVILDYEKLGACRNQDCGTRASGATSTKYSKEAHVNRVWGG
jgi:hypothetical protein